MIISVTDIFVHAGPGGPVGQLRFFWYFNLIPHGGGEKKASLLLIETWLAHKFGVQ